jgi:hypothetical protein
MKVILIIICKIIYTNQIHHLIQPYLSTHKILYQINSQKVIIKYYKEMIRII